MAYKTRPSGLGSCPNAKSAADLRSRTSRGENEEILQAEVKRLSSKVAELNAQAQNEAKAVREMDSLNAEVQRLTDKLRQCVVEKTLAEQKAAQEERAAKEMMSQRDAALRGQAAAKLEAERSSALASKLMLQVKELQQQLSEDWLQRTVMQRQIDTYAEEIKQLNSVQEMLDEEKRSRQKLECQLVEQQNLAAALREEFHARLLGDKERIAFLGDYSGLLNGNKQLTDDESIDAFGEVLKRMIVGKSTSEAQKVKRQLLFCFHPDKNPATEVATRITQILNSAEVPGNRRQSPSARKTQAQTSSRTSPMRTGRTCAQNAPPPDRPQSARPRCRV